MATSAQSGVLHDLAAAAGVARGWRDVDGREQVVPEDALQAVLEALGHPTGSDRAIRRRITSIEALSSKLPALLAADVGACLPLPKPCRKVAVTNDEGRSFALMVNDGQAIAPDTPGYYDCEVDGVPCRLAVAPRHCPLPSGRQWGASVQIAALRGARPSAYGTLAELAETVEAFARRGAGALAINPVHALFPGDGGRFSPYSPSSRRFLNGALADPALAGLPPLEQAQGADLIDWASAVPRHHAQLRAAFSQLPTRLRQEIVASQSKNAALHQHAVFDALDARYRPQGRHGFQQWPTAYRKPGNAAVTRFAANHADEIEFHLFVQWLADTGLAAVQSRAKAAGMATGLLGDLAVGVDPGGSDAWSIGDGMLRGLTIGAPPDPLGPLGQNWALTSFSPDELRSLGYADWIAMIRSALAHCGGLRIDHAFGLARLWVIPEGGSSSDGAYLSYPFDDLVRLLTLEAHLAGAFIVAEDLGTSPHGFTHAIEQRHMLGMRVLWFQRAEDHGFIGAADYDAQAVALTGTHDTPTLAGWWRGIDLDWAARLGRLPDDVDRAKAEGIRQWDRGLLWSTICGEEPRPSPDEPDRAVSAAIAHIARTPSKLALVPVEDLCGIAEQPNLPGTVDEHPNWRRRLDAPVADMLDQPGAQARIASLNARND